MARQKGAVPFIGRVGDLSFYKDKVHGYLVRTAGGPSKKQIKRKKSMEPVRRNNSEFGKASGYGALLRRAFRMLVIHCKEYTMSRRLQSLLLSIIKMDEDREPGKRDIEKEHLVKLQGFELNEHLSYQKFFKKEVDIDVRKKNISVKGECTIAKGFAKKAEFYKVVSVAAAVDFKGKQFFYDVKESELLPLRGKRFVFEHPLYERGCLFYGLVICFYRKNGMKMELISDDEMKAGFVSFVE